MNGLALGLDIFSRTSLTGLCSFWRTIVAKSCAITENIPAGDTKYLKLYIHNSFCSPYSLSYMQIKNLEPEKNASKPPLLTPPPDNKNTHFFHISVFFNPKKNHQFRPRFSPRSENRPKQKNPGSNFFRPGRRYADIVINLEIFFARMACIS